ncbi:MAG: hypothetical protein KDA67_00555 [Rhodobacteraceae bacterium]|nr:hypothetical protein [Paracoccaceae bacterium]
MSSLDRRTLLLSLAALPLAACGFQPVYREGGAASRLKGQIRFNLIDSRNGFVLLEHLEARLGRPAGDPRFEATITLGTVEEELVLATASSLSRFTLNGSALVKVIDTQNSTEVFSDNFRETTGYTASAETAVTTAGKRDANDRLMRAMAEQIVLRLTATAQSWAK